MRRFFAFIICAAVMLCTGCTFTAPQSPDYNTSTYTPQSPQYSSEYNYYSYNEPYSDQYQDIEQNYDNMTYEEYLFQYRDEIIDNAEIVTYQELARSVDGMEGEYIMVSGEIIQSFDDGDCITGMIAITDLGYGYDDLVAYSIPKDFLVNRPLEGDIATLWGISAGFTTYESARGDIRTEPAIAVAQIVIY